jgi:hypothetical protein
MTHMKMPSIKAMAAAMISPQANTAGKSSLGVIPKGEVTGERKGAQPALDENRWLVYSHVLPKNVS